MKKILLVISILGFGIWGCADNQSLISPEKIESQKGFLKVTTDNLSLEKRKSSSELIDGEIGGIVSVHLEKRDIEATGWLYFGKESFEGKEKISVDLVNGLMALDFEPSGIPLLKPAILTVKFTGFEIDDEDEYEGQLDFQYIDENGSLAPVEYDELIIDKRHESITVVNARLYHFSRYGFTK